MTDTSLPNCDVCNDQRDFEESPCPNCYVPTEAELLKEMFA